MNGLCTMLEPGDVLRARSVVKLRFADSRLPPRHQRYQKRRASSYKAKEFLERNGWLVTQRGPRAQTRSRTFAARRQLWGMNMLSRRALLTALFATGVVTGLATAIATAAPSQAETQTHSGRSIAVMRRTKRSRPRAEQRRYGAEPKQ
jgi:hypothetical protein